MHRDAPHDEAPARAEGFTLEKASLESAPNRAKCVGVFGMLLERFRV